MLRVCVRQLWNKIVQTAGHPVKRIKAFLVQCFGACRIVHHQVRLKKQALKAFLRAGGVEEKGKEDMVKTLNIFYAAGLSALRGPAEEGFAGFVRLKKEMIFSCMFFGSRIAMARLKMTLS